MKHISSHEITEWMAHFNLHPYDSSLNSFGHAQTAAVVANMLGKKEGGGLFTADDFLPHLKEEIKPQTVEEQIQMAEMFTIINGGKDLRKRK